MFKAFIKGYHWPFIFAVFALLGVGTLFIYSASFHDSGNYMNKHMFWLGMSVIVLFTVPLMGYRTLLSVSYLLYAIAIFMLICVMFIGQKHLGAQRWLRLGPFVVQPSEYAKMATVLALANYLGGANAFESQWKTIFTSLFIVLLPVSLILQQPDLGTSLIFVPVLVSLLFLWGLKYRYLIISGLLAAMALPLAWFSLKPYQKRRLTIFIDPSTDPLGAGYTALQSRIAVGSGQVWGKGYLQGTQSQLQFVPEHHTDFIFCVIGEELGFMGSFGLLFLYGFLFHCGFRIMAQTTDMKARLMAVGFLAILFAQIFINIGMSYGLMPITGLTLPLVSYGGSSMLATALALGLILSVYRERSIF